MKKKKSKENGKQKKNKNNKKKSAVSEIKETISLTRTNRDRLSEETAYSTTHCLVQTVKEMKYGVAN